MCNMLSRLPRGNRTFQERFQGMAAPCGTRQIGWDEVRGKLAEILPQEVCSELGNLTASLKQPEFFLANYDYGKLVVDRGEFRSPCVPEYCQSCKALHKTLHQDNSYTPIPLAAIVSGCVEIFIEYEQEEGLPRHAPLRIIRRSEVFGVFEALDRALCATTAKPSWSVSSGSRSIWIIAPTGDVRLPRELGKLLGTNIMWNAERHPHWKLVECVVRNRHDWHTEILLFPKTLIESIKRAPALFNLLLQIGWKQSSRLRHIATEDADLREAVHRALKAFSLPQGELFQYVTIRHLLDVVRGEATVFRASDGTQSQAGPFDVFNGYLQTALKNMHLSYSPVVMQPACLDRPGEVGYYSLRCPSVPGPRPPKIRESLAQVASSYRDVIQEIGGERAELLGEANVSFFVKTTSDQRPLPESSVAANEALPLSDFYPGQRSSKSNGLFTASPFLLAVARIVRPRLSAPSTLQQRQTRSGVRQAV
jgi:hypothetical protein